MGRTLVDSPTAPPLVRVLLLALLPVIGALIYLEGQDYDSGLVDLQPGTAGQGRLAALVPPALAGLQPAGQVRLFGKDNLYEYVDGHAEYYIGAGFKGLAVGEYAAAEGTPPSLVVNLYDLGKPLYAFGVLMGELGEDARPVELGSLGFATGQGLSFIYGPYYAQVSTFGDQVPLEAVATELAGALKAKLGEVEQLDLSFPDLGEPLSTYFVKEDYRGLGFLANVLERTFRRGDAEITAFLAAPGEGRSGEMVQRLTGFLSEEGIPFERLQRSGQTVYRVADPYEGEWFFLERGGRLLGVFAPLDDELLQAAVAPALPKAGG